MAKILTKYKKKSNIITIKKRMPYKMDKSGRPTRWAKANALQDGQMDKSGRPTRWATMV